MRVTPKNLKPSPSPWNNNDQWVAIVTHWLQSNDDDGDQYR
jgi:hypothetical protein